MSVQTHRPTLKDGRNSSHFLTLFCCIYGWDGFVWLISICICSCKRSPREVVLVRKRDALYPSATQTTTSIHLPRFIPSWIVAPPSGLQKTKPIFFNNPLPRAVLRRRLGIISVTSEILSFNSISFTPHEEWHCNQHWFPSHGVMIEIFCRGGSQTMFSSLCIFFYFVLFPRGRRGTAGVITWYATPQPQLSAMSSAVKVSKRHHNWFICSVLLAAVSILWTWLKMFFFFSEPPRLILGCHISEFMDRNLN